MTMKKALTIAGSDSSGGAGIQADLKTFQELDVYGMTALTTVVAMDPKNNWYHQVFPQNIETVKAQLETILSIGVDALKTGMLGSVEIIELAAEKIKEHQLKNVVVDPVMVCKGEDEVLFPEHTLAYREALLPLATVTTPNLFEASQLAGMQTIITVDQMKKAAEKIHSLGVKYVVIKGGSKLQGTEKAIDLVYDGQEHIIIENDLIETSYTHGAGCTFAAAITAELALGKEVPEAIRIAKDFITEAIRHSWKLNEYVGPTMHSAYKANKMK